MTRTSEDMRATKVFGSARQEALSFARICYDDNWLKERPQENLENWLIRFQ